MSGPSESSLALYRAHERAERRRSALPTLWEVRRSWPVSGTQPLDDPDAVRRAQALAQSDHEDLPKVASFER